MSEKDFLTRSTSLNNIVMKIYKLVACILIGLATVVSSYAQKSSTSAADAVFDKGDFYDAVPIYKKAFSKEKNKAKKAEILFKTGECYRMVNDFKNEEVWYDKAIKGGYKEPEVYFLYAQALKLDSKYDEAIVQYNALKKAAPNDTRADVGIQSCEQAQKWKDKPTRYKVDNLSALNSKNRDFGIAYSSKDHRSVIFTSARSESMGKGTDGWTGEKFTDLFEASVDKKGKWSNPKPLLEPVNSEANEGFVAMDKKGNSMYFTRCENEKGKIGVCDIYSTKRKGQTWEEPVMVHLCPDSFTVGQPSISADEQTIYFVSNMPGGFGGKDIWKADWDKKSRTWGAPVNLGSKVNTDEDEMFPFIASDNTLYFSSRGHVGMGGLDIYKSKMAAGGGWDEAVNLKSPINSPADDFAFLTDDSNDHGYLSSDREGGKGSDDIYEWKLPPLVFTISGKVFDADTKALLEDVNIELFGSDGTSIPFKTDRTATYKFDLKPETSYKVSASKKDYLNKYLEMTTVGLENSRDFIGDFDFALKSIIKPIELPNILYDLGKWDLRPESKVALDELVTTMNDNPRIVIELGSHTDSRPIPMTNDTLSQRRAQSVVNYLIEKGVDADRLVAKGYGEKEPRTFDKNMGSFKAGTVLDDAFIATIKKTPQKEEAHQLNRRTEFRVLRNNYVKGQKGTDNTPGGTVDSSSKKMEVKDEVKNVEKPKDEPVSKEPGKVYVAEKKDTYMSISKKFSISMKDLKTINGLKSEQLYEGMELKVEKSGDYTDYDSKFYVLEAGDDSYSKIAKKLNLKTSDLKKMNKEVEETSFHPGKRIRISK